MRQADPSQHVQPFAPEFAKPNFFEEVEKRGLAGVLGGIVENVKHDAATAMDQ